MPGPNLRLRARDRIRYGLIRDRIMGDAAIVAAVA